MSERDEKMIGKSYQDFPNNNAKGPNIRLSGIRIVGNGFRRHVLQRPEV